MNNLFNKTGSEQAWDAARLRLEDYLRAVRLAEVATPREQEQIVTRLMKCAVAEAHQSPGGEPTWLLMKQFRAAVKRWFGQIYPACEFPAQVGLINWFALEPAARRPGIFLAANLPVDLQFRLSTQPVRPVPALNLSHMLPLPLANPFHAVADIPVRLRKLACEWGRKLSPGMASALAAITVWLGVRLR